MLNTIMALWNQNPGENRQRIVKVIFTILLISVSASLFLFTLNSSAWSPFAGAQGQQIKRAEQPKMRNSRGIAIAGNTPVGDTGTAGIMPTATVIAQPSCVQAPAVAVPQRTTTRAQNVVIYSGKSDLGKGNSEPRYAHPKAVLVKKGKPHSDQRPKVKVIATSIPQATPTIQPMVTPVATAITMLTDGTVVSNVPAIVTASGTPDMSATSTTQFIKNLQQKGVRRDPVSPSVKSDKKNDHVHGKVECSRSTTHKDSSGGTTLKVGRHAGQLLGSSLLGMLLLYCFAFVFKREE